MTSSMYNQAAVEALCSATYLSNYLDSLENLPDDLQRNISQMRELDRQCNELLSDIEAHQQIYESDVSDNVTVKRALLQIQRLLVRNQEIGDEKLQLVAEMVDLIENRKHQLGQDLENLDPQINDDVSVTPSHHPAAKLNTTNAKKEPKKDKVEKVVSQVSQESQVPQKEEVISVAKADKVGQKRQRRKVQHEISTHSKEEDKKDDEKPKKKKKRKIKKDIKEGTKSPNLEPIDPDEPTYCLCEQISYGEMIGCDNEQCEIEWFHFQCVSLTNKPKGKWYCPNCRGDTSKVKKHM